MKVAVVGASGNVGGVLCRLLLSAGVRVRALTRDGEAAARLAALGAEPYIGSFEDGTVPMEGFFRDADAAFTMVRTNWSEPDHYRLVAARIAAALRGSSVRQVVNLSSIGADLAEGAGHVSDFFQLERAFDSLGAIRVLHLRCAWFMENFLRMIDGIIRHGTLATMFRRDVAVSCVATRDIALVAAGALSGSHGAARSVREVQGHEDLTMVQVAARISEAIVGPVACVEIPTDSSDVRAMFLERFGTRAVWEHRVAMYRAFNEGRARWSAARTAATSTATSFQVFLREDWLPVYNARLTAATSAPETFESFVGGLGAAQLAEHRKE